MQISPKILDLLNQQISHEGLNSQKYAVIAAELQNAGLDNIAGHFLGQVKEEQGHQELLRNYITDRNEKVRALAIPAFDFIFANDILSVANTYLETEQTTTAQLKNIATEAWNEGDYITFNFIMSMVDIQRTEEAEALTFLDKAILADGAPEVLLLWDANFSL